MEDATALLMPAWIEGETCGVKLANIYPSNGALGLPAVSAAYKLYDGRTGQFRAMIDGGVLGARRTAATSAEITLFKSVGAAIEDLAAARLVAAAAGGGRD